MFRRAAAAAALAVAGLTAAAPVATASPTATPTATPAATPTATPTGSAELPTSQDPPGPKGPDGPRDVPPGSGNVELLNGLNLLPVQACNLGIPILSGVLDSPDGACSVDNDAAQD